MTDRPATSGASFLIRATDPADVVTPDDLGEEERMLVRTMEEFAEREVAPVMDRLETRDPEVSRALFRKAAELGVFMAEVPEEYGGLDLNVLAITGMLASRGDFGALGPMILGHQGIGMLPIVNFGTPEQIEKYLVPCMEGTLLSAFALTEPGTGSDAMNIRTRAVLDEAGTHYVVNGAKQWITNAGWADIFILFAKVDGESFTAFIMERDTPGLAVGEPERLLGQRGSYVAALSMEDVRIPVENVLGEVGKGHKVAFCTLNMGRLKLAAGSATGAAKALGIAARYAGERIQFGRPIAEFGLIQRKLADMAARTYAAESVAYRTAGLVYRALEDMARGGTVTPDVKLATLAEFSVECALAKVYASEAYNGLADEAVQIFGGYGFSEEYPAAPMYRDSRIARIYEGTNEICRLYAQRTVFKRWAAGRLDLSGTGGAGASEDGANPRGATEADTAGTRASGDAAGGTIEGMKAVYRRLAGAVVAGVGPEGLSAPGSQQFLGSLADIAIEIYAAESTYLRVAKLVRRGDDGHGALREALLAITLDRAAERIRREARTVLAELTSPKERADRIAALEALLPLPAPLVEARGQVAEQIVASGGEIPAAARVTAQPA